MFISTELVPGTGPAKKNRQPWSHGPAPPKKIDNHGPTDQPRQNIPTTQVPRTRARRDKRTRHQHRQYLSLWPCMPNGCIEQSGAAGCKCHFQRGRPGCMNMGAPAGAVRTPAGQGPKQHHSPPDLVQCPDRQCAQSRWASDVGSNDHIIGPAWLSTLRVGALYGRWLRMVLIGPFTCWIANCPCRMSMSMQPGRALGNAIGGQPRQIVRCSHSTCTTRVTEIGHVDVASACLAEKHHGPSAWGHGLSEYLVGAGPWDLGCRIFLSGLVPGTTCAEINVDISETSENVLKM